MAESTSTARTFTGSCHCRFIVYQATISLPPSPAPLLATRCNCTVCLKSGFTGVQLPEGNFKLIAPASLSEVPDYQPRVPTVHHYFCNKCGVQVCGAGVFEIQGHKVDFFQINVVTLDQPQDGLDLSELKLEYWDGRNDNFVSGKKATPWPGGCL